ncbi:hypothetical protein JAAARDRAFT_193425 [Jaapia argillacea MUCL 33604]|uniref:Transcription factor TFIIIC triple barrel domain-containing protein n=1 Tax=Jaapia argillacea MUCL 33604 TaxID=933084 RepID=A0A067PT08_9AGAM|nr:hypothetical protein JAAARDRAFT_193425 [Jaapia argillacea MUCL 33604]
MGTRNSLFPGYKQVDSFGPDEEYELSEEEITYLTLDLGSVEPTLVPSSSSYRLIGLDTPTPFLQLAGSIFKGQHQSLLGTELLFTDNVASPHPAPEDAEPNKPRSLLPVGTTSHRIRFKEVQLKPKNKVPPQETGDPSTSALPQTSAIQAKFPDPPADDPEPGPSTSTGRGRGRGRGRGKGSRGGARGKGKSKGKGKERAVEGDAALEEGAGAERGSDGGTAQMDIDGLYIMDVDDDEPARAHG